jgi:predicted PurR-regulated permease PerM
MARTVSFIVLVVATSVLLALFYQVVSVFLLPLFLAAVTVLLLRPLHLKIVRGCGNRRYLAASIMTISVLLAVLIPVLTVFVLAGQEAAQLASRLDNDAVKQQLERVRSSLDLDYPFADEARFIETSLNHLQAAASNGATAKGDDAAVQNVIEELRRMDARVLERADEHPHPMAEPVLHQLAKVSRATPGTLFYQRSINSAVAAFRNYKLELLGGVWKMPLKEMFNPTTLDLQRVMGQMFSVTAGGIASIGGATSVVAAKMTFGLLIFVMAMFFWFADGPEIVKALMVLSPLEDKYEEQLLVEFEVLVRAVVAGSIASAVTQAVLAGVGFWFVGLQSIFLLMALTGVLAMVPFVGASLVWIPASLWIAVVEGNTSAGIGLALYGLLIISTIDNVIRPWIIVERASLHPLAGLVGVLGGIQAMGPTGVFVGPIVVAFLQTLLTLLHREFSDAGDVTISSAKSEHEGTAV